MSNQCVNEAFELGENLSDRDVETDEANNKKQETASAPNGMHSQILPEDDLRIPETMLKTSPDEETVSQIALTEEKTKEDVDVKEENETSERGAWSNKLDFLFSCISVSVGLGNIWRFPYLCYKNGGGAFLIAYFVAMVFCGIPIFYAEVALGQYLGVGGMTFIGQIVPIMKGVGFATMVVVVLIDIYYTIIIAWTLFYLIASFTALPSLPWAGCNNTWNTPNCYVPTEITNLTIGASISSSSVSAVEEFWTERVLGITDGIENLSSVRWELFGTLILAWILVYFIIWKGLNESGYIVWFTALFPYAILLVLLVRAVTLEGAEIGLLYYVTPKWDLLLTAGPWIDGTTQIFFAYSIGTGALPALGSYNTFKYNCFRDAMITCLVNTLTCLIAGVVTFAILGTIAHSTNASIDSVVNSGPGLVFITYPEVVLRLPGAPAWAVLFFIMLAVLGIDSEFCNVESFVTGLSDNWPEKLRKNRKFFTFLCVLVMFLFDIPMITKGGVYVFQLMDYYSASGMSMLFLVFFQTISIAWIFGTSRFCDCIEQMSGKRPSWFFYICWSFLGPLVMAGVFLFYVIQYIPVTYGENYQYPWWAEVIGIIISLSSMLWIPGYAAYYIITTPGTLREVLVKGMTPICKPRKGAPSLPLSGGFKEANELENIL
ncbi:sodium- and chloride-dependent GABA transporter 1-like [Daphnia pulex]|uniref:sodium- and chloride-dependent GABA transporter 1-like n=1 Tax=Daphnia pulex TaxID=6669 RepID=UPI001EDD2535|nr:sodium- and chloride-dependent GABA transporter 1-like [Daphnia pulex]XP_046462932.1 sodium- and chloride-dependent GABA transporter 1-like [Daphnia pulex]